MSTETTFGDCAKTSEKDRVDLMQNQIQQMIAAIALLAEKVSKVEHLDRSASFPTLDESANRSHKRIRVEPPCASTADASTSAGFIVPRTRHQGKTTTAAPFQLPTSNSFAELEVPMEPEFQAISGEEAPPPPPKPAAPKRSPPVVIHNLPSKDVNATAQALLSATDGRAKFSCRGSNFSVITSSKEDWNAIKAVVSAPESRLQYHTYTHPDEKKKALVMRGAHASLDPTVIEEELKTSHGIDAKVSVLTRRRKDLNGQVQIIPMPLFQVLVGQNTAIEKIMAVRHVSHYQVAWETKRGKTQVTQCHRCQRFGHGATNCGLDYRCIKCKAVHKPGECTNSIASSQPAICVNCSQEHPANFRDCPARLQYLARRAKTASAGKLSLQRGQQPREIVLPSRVAPGVSYAHAASKPNVGPSAPNPQNSRNNIERLLEDSQTRFGMDFVTLAQTVSKFYTELDSVVDESVKTLKFLAFAGTFNMAK